MVNASRCRRLLAGTVTAAGAVIAVAALPAAAGLNQWSATGPYGGQTEALVTVVGGAGTTTTVKGTVS